MSDVTWPFVMVCSLSLVPNFLAVSPTCFSLQSSHVISYTTTHCCFCDMSGRRGIWSSHGVATYHKPSNNRRRENNNHRRKIKTIQIYNRQPALNRDQCMEIPAITMKLLSCGHTGSHDEWRQPTYIPLKMAARCSPKIREQFLFSPFKTQRVERQFFYYESWELWIPITYTTTIAADATAAACCYY